MNKSLHAALGRLEGRRIAILGFGREGQSTYTFLRSRLASTRFVVADQIPPPDPRTPEAALSLSDPDTQTFFGDTYLDGLEECDVIFKTPGILPRLDAVIHAGARGVEITSNTKLFFDLCPGTIVGVTGTKGKSTTTSMIHRVLQATDREARLAGNIGVPPLSALPGATSQTVFALELSSYQLLNLERSPHIAVLQRIVPEHLTYHGTFEAYADAKGEIFRHQTSQDIALFNDETNLPRAFAEASPGLHLPFAVTPKSDSICFLEDGWIIYDRGTRESIMPAAQIPLVGSFNVVNVLPAVVVGRLFGLSGKIISEAIASLKPLEHRLEFVAELNGVSFYDDSISTVPESAVAAIESLDSSPVVLVAGGYDRGLEYSILAQAILARNVRAVILFAPTGRRLWEAVRALSDGAVPLSHEVETMREAVDAACDVAEPGDVVLLSPASASFGRFRDYRDRGEQFKAEVERRKHLQ